MQSKRYSQTLLCRKRCLSQTLLQDTLRENRGERIDKRIDVLAFAN